MSHKVILFENQRILVISSTIFFFGGVGRGPLEF